MADFANLPPEYREAEDVLNRLRGVTSSHIVLDSAGQIAEVHVIASGERHPKQIVRDVESALFAKLGIKVDHRKISVALLEAGKQGASGDSSESPLGKRSREPAMPRGFPAAEEAQSNRSAEESERLSRLRFLAMNLQVSGAGCQATVELLHGAVRTLGDSSTPGVGKGALRSLAEATLRAVMHCYQEGSAFTVDDIAFMTLGQREVVLVSVSYHLGREAVQLLGSTFVGLDPQQAVIFATLDAVNRFSGRLKERAFIEYEVGPTPAKV